MNPLTNELTRSTRRTPITELRSKLSTDLDIAGTNASLEMLQRCDLQIFGDEEFAGLSDSQFLRNVGGLWSAMAERPFIPMVLAGAGTSGRLCRMIELEARRAGSACLRPVYATLPGGARHLRAAKPLGEDEFLEGTKAFERLRAIADKVPVVAVGVTCGLSAKYVEAFVEAARVSELNLPAIIGFNPAGDALINLFQDDLAPKTYLLNPIIGPEAVAGSVRLKGGSATLMILLALLAAEKEADIASSFARYRHTLTLLPSLNPFLAEAIEAATRSLRSQGRIYLLGQQEWGALCIFDAAECVPTFSAPEGLVEGFADDGWKSLIGQDDLADHPHEWADNVSWDRFQMSRVSTLTADDTIVILESGHDKDRLRSLLQWLSHLPNVFLISVGHGLQEDHLCRRAVSLVDHGIGARDCQLIATRILLGRLSTCVFAHAGALYENLMIDHRVTNRKLLRRAVALVSTLAPTDEQTALAAITQVVYKDASVSAPATEEGRDALVLAAIGVRRMVPQAIWHVRDPHMPLDDVAAKIEAEPVLRRHAVNGSR